METRIVDFIKNNGKSTALTISEALGVDKKIINKHLYKLQKSNLLKTMKGPPLWDLKENTEDPKSELTSDSRSIDAVSTESEILTSVGRTGFKANQIAKDVGQPKETVKKHLYSMEKKGKVWKSDSNLWVTKSETSLKQYSKSCEDVSFSDLGSRLSQCFHEITHLGSGGYGCVFKARHKYDDKMYAVKRVMLTKNADSEVKALAQLNHPNIVRYITCWQSSETWESYHKSSQSSSSVDNGIVFDGSDHDISDVSSGVESLDTTSESECAAEPFENHSTDSEDPLNQSYLFIQMDFCEGGTLTAWIHERNFTEKQRTTDEIYQIFYEIVSGVEYIHSKKFIHRDLKPDNIFFTADGKVKIGDFGLVAPLMNPNGCSGSRSIGKGTPSYMSPEQKKEKRYNAKTDIFPLGLIWFEMLWKLSCGMERGKIWPDLRKQTFPEGFCHEHKNEYKFIRKMLSHTPQDRPKAKKIKENLDRFFNRPSDQNVLRQKTI